jgi:site-specific recombinase XerD
VRGKGAKERWVLFGKPAEAALRRYLQESRPKLATGSTPALFLNRYGQRLSRRSIEMLVRRYAARAGLRDGVHPHTLRHTFASHMLEGDADLRVIQELLGHSSPTTTQIYTHVTKQEARQAYLNYHPRAGNP